MRDYCDSNYASFNQKPKYFFEGGCIYSVSRIYLRPNIKYIVENSLTFPTLYLIYFHYSS